MYRLRVDSGERTTSKFRLVNSENQKGRFSYMFSPKGMPTFPREPSPWPLPWRERRWSYLNFSRSGMSALGWPRGTEQRLPEMNRRPPSNLLMVREHRLVQPLQVAGRASWVKVARASGERREDFSSPASLAARAAP